MTKAQFKDNALVLTVNGVEFTITKDNGDYKLEGAGHSEIVKVSAPLISVIDKAKELSNK